MQISLLDTFLAVAECGGFHCAAHKLNVTQAAVSARIKQLEQILDAKLFERGPGGTSLNEAGRFFQPYADQIVKTWKHVSTDTSRRFSGRISLRLGAQLSIWDQILVDLIVWVEAEMGKLPLTLNFDHEMNMYEAVRHSFIDLAITHEPVTGANLICQELPPETLILVATTRCAIDDLVLPLFVNFSLGAEFDANIADVLPEQAAQHIFLGNSTMGLRYLHQRGGMAYCPKSMVVGDLNEGSLYAVEGAPQLSLSCFAIYNPASSTSNLINRVIEGLNFVRNQVELSFD